MHLRLLRFLQEDLWLLNVDELSAGKRLIIKYLKIFILAIRGFIIDDCPLRASALTLYTLLSIVPIIAMLFGVAKGFGFEKRLEERILEQVPEQDTTMLQIIDFAKNLLANTQGGVVAGIGLVVLFWTVIKVISNIEESFNHIWKIKKARSVSRKLSDYLSLMLLAPILLILASSISVYVSTQITTLMQAVHMPNQGTFAILSLLNYLPVIIIWTLFSFTFIFMPNTQVNYLSGIIAGIFTGTVYQLVQSAYFSLQLGVSSYNAIYGSFAALPLFLLWLQIGWLIVLLGSEIAFYHQHFINFRHKDKLANLNFFNRKIIALQICHLIVYNFSRDKPLLTVEAIAEQLDMPIAVAQTLLNDLLESGVIAPVKEKNQTGTFYLPAKDTALITVASIISAMEHQGNHRFPGSQDIGCFKKTLEGIETRFAKSAENRLLKEIERLS